MAATPPDISFDLDAVERPADQIRPIFKVNVGGKVIEMQDPAELDWQDLAEVGDPVGLLAYAVSDEDREHIRKQNIPAWKFGELIDAYQKHYKLDELQKQARRRQGR